MFLMTNQRTESYHACFTGDCPHDTEVECWKEIHQHCVKLEAAESLLRGAIEKHRSPIKGRHGYRSVEIDEELYDTLKQLDVSENSDG